MFYKKPHDQTYKSDVKTDVQHTDVTAEDEGCVSMTTSWRNPNVQRNLPLHLSLRIVA